MQRGLPRTAAAALLGALFAAPGTASAQQLAHPSEVVSITTALPKTGFTAGETFQAALVLDIQAGYHINSHGTSDPTLIPTTVSAGEESPVEWAFIRYPEDLARSGRSVLGLDGDAYHDRVIIRLVGKVPEDASPGTLILPVEVEYQTCTDQVCLFPFTKETSFEVPLVTEGTPVESINTEIFGKPGGGGR